MLEPGAVKRLFAHVLRTAARGLCERFSLQNRRHERSMKAQQRSLKGPRGAPKVPLKVLFSCRASVAAFPGTQVPHGIELWFSQPSAMLAEVPCAGTWLMLGSIKSLAVITNQRVLRSAHGIGELQSDDPKQKE